MNRFYRSIACISIASAAFISCQEDQPAVNTLEVSPSSPLMFEALGNEGRVLEITTDAPSWEVEAPEWVITSADGNMLSVNVRDNAGAARSGRITVSAGNADPVHISVVQSEAPEDVDILAVEPDGPITFSSSGNRAVDLRISTNVSEWRYSAPEWIEASAEGDVLRVNAKDNSSEQQRIGRLTISAGEAAPVVINVMQEGLDPDAVPVSPSDAEGGKGLALVIEKLDVMQQTVRLTLAEAAKGDVSLELYYDGEYLSQYNYINDEDCLLYPPDLVSFGEDNGVVTISEGQTSAEAVISIDPDSYSLRNGVRYLIPVAVRTKSSNVSVSSSDMRVNYTISRKCEKKAKTILYFEVNDVNPLNALEYRLEDGTMFFDAVVLFAANINYDYRAGEVILSNNPNVQALLDGTDVYLQPLREAGIKVYLGLLGNHDIAGICQLSKWGAQQYAVTLAEAVRQYKLDGVNFDDEYSQSPDTSLEWFTSPSPAAGARLLYETKNAMEKIVPWETEVSIYQYGNLRGQLPSVDGHRPGEFVDIVVADYGMAASPLDGMDYSSCSVMSVQLASDQGDVGAAYRTETRGYGWMMFFSFDPVKKLDGGVNAFDIAADGLWGMNLLDPTGIYYKTGEGTYDPERHELP